MKEEMMNMQEQPAAQPGIVQGQMAKPQQQKADPKQIESIIQRMAAAAQKVIYEKSVTPQLLEIVKGLGDPVKGVAQATLVVLDQLREKVKGVDPNYVYYAAPLTALLIFELAEAAKVLRFKPEMAQQALTLIQGALAKRGGAQTQQQPAQPAEAPAAAPAEPAPAAGAPVGAPQGDLPVVDEEAVEEDPEAK